MLRLKVICWLKMLTLLSITVRLYTTKQHKVNKMKLNKTIKTQLVNAAIEAKYKDQHERYMRELTVAAREYAIKNSHHESLKSKLTNDELQHVSYKVRFNFDDVLRTDDYIFNGDVTHVNSMVSDDPVYAYYGGYYLKDEDLPQLATFRQFVLDVVADTRQLQGVVGSYTTAKRLFEDLPWLKQYYPESEPTGTGLVDKATIDAINARFGNA